METRFIADVMPGRLATWLRLAREMLRERG